MDKKMFPLLPGTGAVATDNQREPHLSVPGECAGGAGGPEAQLSSPPQPPICGAPPGG